MSSISAQFPNAAVFRYTLTNISAVVTAVPSAAVSIMVLIQQVQTACFVNQLAYNTSVTVTLTTQECSDKNV